MYMQSFKLIIFFSVTMCASFFSLAQEPQDSILQEKTVSIEHRDGNSRFLPYKKLILPTVLIGYGIGSLHVDALKQLNFSTKNEINEHQPDHIRLDNYTQYMPAAMVYGLNAAGIKGEHNFKERTIIYATSQLISTAIVVPLKHVVKEQRPDGSNRQSFPSGHTATAFSSAQFLYREYKDRNFLLSISGYPLAIFTGMYRTLNNKHWVGDVVAGAGIGILSTELSYWLYPKFNRLFGKGKSSNVVFYPSIQQGNYGVGFVKQF